MKIPKEIFVAMRETSGLAYVTYQEDNSAFQKRKSTGLNWAEISEGVTYLNELLDGYIIRDNISRWTTSNVVWRVLDPRGFEFEIYSGNMMEVIKNASIKNGTIQGRCILSFDSGKPVLLPEGSEPYLNAVKSTTISVTSKNTVLTVNKLYVDSSEKILQYLGAFHIIREECKSDNYHNRTMELTITPKKYYIFVIVEDGKLHKASSNGDILILTKPNVIEYTDSNVVVPDIKDPLKFVNLAKDICYYGNVSTYDIIGFCTSNKHDVKYSIIGDENTIGYYKELKDGSIRYTNNSKYHYKVIGCNKILVATSITPTLNCDSIRNVNISICIDGIKYRPSRIFN